MRLRPNGPTRADPFYAALAAAILPGIEALARELARERSNDSPSARESVASLAAPHRGDAMTHRSPARLDA